MNLLNTEKPDKKDDCAGDANSDLAHFIKNTGTIQFAAPFKNCIPPHIIDEINHIFKLQQESVTTKDN